MHFTLISFSAALLVYLPAFAAASPLRSNTVSFGHKPHHDPSSSKKAPITLPFNKHSRRILPRDGMNDDIVGGSVGLGDSADLFYTVALTIGNSMVSLNLDTGSSDLWAFTTACSTPQCQQTSSTPYDDTQSFRPSGGSVDLRYGDSKTGTHASGPVGRDTVTLAGLTLEDQPLAAVNDTDNSAVSNGGAGIFGLGFPAQSFVQAATIAAEIQNRSAGTDTFILETGHSGPLISRLIEAEAIDEPLFAITLQRDTIDVSGQGQVTIGTLPEGIDNSSITWVPVRLYRDIDGGLQAPAFAPTEVYPLTQQASGIQQPSLSALIDTGNSLIRGPSDVVSTILQKASPAFAADPTARPTLPCASGHTLAFQIGGKLFPVDPRDFVSQAVAGDAVDCVADNVVGTDPPGSGALFSWNLGDPFLKSNAVVFYYGNLTHPSVDPPRMGFVSLVPKDADELLDDAVEDAQKDGGNFESTVDIAPTSSSLILESEATSSTSISTSIKATATFTKPVEKPPSRTSSSSSSSSSTVSTSSTTTSATYKTGAKTSAVPWQTVTASQKYSDGPWGSSSSSWSSSPSPSPSPSSCHLPDNGPWYARLLFKDPGAACERSPLFQLWICSLCGCCGNVPRQ
ncbi:acid protease [Pilatotrama ljubarskyi]|nr:acid protease [Pilatotrama ljubarskyi]